MLPTGQETIIKQESIKDRKRRAWSYPAPACRSPPPPVNASLPPRSSPLPPGPLPHPVFYMKDFYSGFLLSAFFIVPLFLPYFPVPCTAGLFMNSLTAITRPPGPPSSGPDADSWQPSHRQYSGHYAPSSPAPAAVPLHQTGPLPLSATGIVHMHP